MHFFFLQEEAYNGADIGYALDFKYELLLWFLFAIAIVVDDKNIKYGKI